MEKIADQLLKLVESCEFFSQYEKSFWKHLIPVLDTKTQEDIYEAILSGQKNLRTVIEKNIEKLKKIKNRHIQEWENLILMENKKTMKLVSKNIKEDDEKNIKKIYDQLKIN